MVEIFGKGAEEYVSDLKRVYDAVEKSFSLPKKAKVSLNFVSEKKIQQLNKKLRNIDKITDVLTFPYVDLKVGQKLKLSDYKCNIDPEDKTLLIGDIYICLARAKEQAKELNNTLRREICFLFCHGLLHICGYDHMTPDDEKLMTEKQNEIMDKLGIPRGLYRCGFVTIIGETNVGKSSLINRLVGEHVAIVSPKTQTTREKIIGVYNDDLTQIVFVDTPGYHKARTKIDIEMDKHIADAMTDTEIILMMISAKKPLIPQYEKLEKMVSSSAKKILIINKIDEVSFERLYPELDALSKVCKVDEILPLSALSGKNCDVLLDMVKNFLPTFEREFRYFPLTDYTDKTMRHMVAEIVREKALFLLDDEVPHGIHVSVTEFSEEEKPIKISADIYCEKENHKAIIIGKKGEKLKSIGTSARRDIEKLIGEQVNLNLFVKVRENWREDPKSIAEFGLNCDN